MKNKEKRENISFFIILGIIINIILYWVCTIECKNLGGNAAIPFIVTAILINGIIISIVFVKTNRNKNTNNSREGISSLDLYNSRGKVKDDYTNY